MSRSNTLRVVPAPVQAVAPSVPAFDTDLGAATFVRAELARAKEAAAARARQLAPSSEVPFESMPMRVRYNFD